MLNLAEHLGNVSKACKLMGYCRDSFYRIKELYDTGGEIALFEISRSNHDYELYLTIEGIDHSRTKVRHPQSNGICERFHRTIQ